MLSIFTIIQIIILFQFIHCEQKCQVNLNNSDTIAIGGYNTTFNYERDYCSYLGIPYAEPPIDSLAFKPPIPSKYWNGSKEFLNWPDICVHFFEEHYPNESLDCLYLNVFVPYRSNEQNRTDKMPVLLYIHGGSWGIGSSMSEVRVPERYIEQDVVVVTFNYRLTAFGFMRIPEFNVSGNMGLMDQQLAMKWVKNHIYEFGGDPNLITLMGWSAGAASVSYHMYLTEDLFQRAILISGSFLSSWATIDQPTLEQNSKLFLQNNECNSTDCWESLKQNISTFKPFFGLCKFYIYAPQFYSDNCLIPHVDNEYITKLPYDMVLHKPKTNVPVMLGYTSIEFSHPFEEEFTVQPLVTYHYPENTKKFNGFLKECLKNGTNVQNVVSKLTIEWGANEFAEILKEHSNENVYVYRFTHSEDNSVTKHGDDLDYLLRHRQNGTELENNFQQKVTSLMVNFMRYGKPSFMWNSTHSFNWTSISEDPRLLELQPNFTYHYYHNITTNQMGRALYKCNNHNHCNFEHIKCG